MIAIVISSDDTAYPQSPRVITDRDLEDFFTPADEEIAFVTQATRDDPGLHLSFMLLLKCMQYLNYLPEITDIPLQIVNHIRNALSMDDTVQPGYPNDKTKYRHHKAVRRYLGVVPYAHPTAAPLLRDVLHRATQQMSDPGDLINLALAELLLRNYELPAFSTLDRMGGHVRDQVHDEMFLRIDQRLTQEDKDSLDQLLVSASHAQLSELFQIKKPAGPASVSHMREMYRRLVYLEGIIPIKTILAGLHPSKIMLFASEAEVLDASRMIDTRPDRKYALKVCLLHEA